MSDLQCAARIIVLNPPSLADVPDLVGDLTQERIVAVYAADDVPDTGPVESLADFLGVSSHLGHGDLDDNTDGFQEIVDRHRGEAVVIVRGGEEREPVLLLVDSDGTSVQRLGDPT
jgi:hypothetical protein